MAAGRMNRFREYIRYDRERAVRRMECLEVDVVMKDISLWWKALEEQHQHQTPCLKPSKEKMRVVKNISQYQRDGETKKIKRRKEKLKTDWSFKLSGWSIWWLRQEREAYKAGKISSEKEHSRRMEATRVEAQAAKSTFIKNMGKQHQPQQVKYQMEGDLEASSFLEVMEDGDLKVRIGIAESNGGKEIKTDCEDSIETGDRKQNLTNKNENIPALICESSTNIYDIVLNRRDKFVSAQDGNNPLTLPSKPYNIERTMEVDPGDELNPEELATAELF
jgi:hypothetical protein